MKKRSRRWSGRLCPFTPANTLMVFQTARRDGGEARVSYLAA